MSAPDAAAPRRFARYVAIGDSSTEGIDDRDGRGGYRGWSLRLAERIAATQGGLLHANLAVRGRTTREVLDEQLDAALAMRPDLATVFTGTNDVVARGFDADAVAADMEQMQRRLVACGATVLTFTLPDLAPLIPLARGISPRIHAMNAGLRAACTRTGTILLDFAAVPVATDARLWSDDRIHANALGHARIAEALAHALGLPGASDAWRHPLPPAPPRGPARRAANEFAWMVRHLLPWMALGLRAGRARSRRAPKRPALTPVGPPGPG